MYQDFKRTCRAIVLLIKTLFGDVLVAVAGASLLKQILLLGNKIDAGNNASRVAKLGNIGETCALRVFLETYFLVFPGL